MKSSAFGYLRVSTLADAFKAMADNGPDARLLAGGQTLLATLAFRLSEPSTLIDISRIEALHGIRREADLIRVGAGTTHAVLGRDPLIRRHVPLLTRAVPHIAHAAIRNRGTIGGTLAYADPAAELPACALALGASIVATSANGERKISADDFFTGLFSTALAEDEIITAVEFPVATATARSTLIEIARRSGDYAMAGIAFTADISGSTWNDVRAVFFGVGPTAVRAKGAEAALSGSRGGADAVAAAQRALDHDLDPPGDPHGGPAFKRQLARTVLSRAVNDILDAGATSTQ